MALVLEKVGLCLVVLASMLALSAYLSDDASGLQYLAVTFSLPIYGFAAALIWIVHRADARFRRSARLLPLVGLLVAAPVGLSGRPGLMDETVTAGLLILVGVVGAGIVFLPSYRARP